MHYMNYYWPRIFPNPQSVDPFSCSLQWNTFCLLNLRVYTLFKKLLNLFSQVSLKSSVTTVIFPYKYVFCRKSKDNSSIIFQQWYGWCWKKFSGTNYYCFCRNWLDWKASEGLFILYLYVPLILFTWTQLIVP